MLISLKQRDIKGAGQGISKIRKNMFCENSGDHCKRCYHDGKIIV